MYANSVGEPIPIQHGKRKKPIWIVAKTGFRSMLLEKNKLWRKKIFFMIDIYVMTMLSCTYICPVEYEILTTVINNQCLSKYRCLE